MYVYYVCVRVTFFCVTLCYVMCRCGGREFNTPGEGKEVLVPVTVMYIYIIVFFASNRLSYFILPCVNVPYPLLQINTPPPLLLGTPTLNTTVLKVYILSYLQFSYIKVTIWLQL